ncbi:MAG: adenine deaminase [Bacteroidales bacterium]|nr:adenine deaminase [Bacteroidales bacterium]
MIQIVTGNIVDIDNREVFGCSIEIENGIIIRINRVDNCDSSFIIPGFIDSHVHIESSMLVPREFGRMVIGRGTVAVVCDPHEIANVKGVEGVDFMIEDSKESPIKTFFTIPSCVPATPFDVAGGIISAGDIEQMIRSSRFVALSEMMNVPGVLTDDPDVLAKIRIAKRTDLPVDGHAPALFGEQLRKYVKCGISTDHECLSLEEAQEKIAIGMKILIREGSAARNYETFKSLIRSNPDDVMFCTDDSHPDELMLSGHIDKIVRRAIADGFDLFDVLKIACINPVNHYKLDVGKLKAGDRADFVIVDSLESFGVKAVYIDGVRRYGEVLSGSRRKNLSKEPVLNNFNHEKIHKSQLKKRVTAPIKVISVTDGELLTDVYEYKPLSVLENLESDLDEDILKIVYINRYKNGKPQIAFCKGFNLKNGAFASTVSHDSHNILAIGCKDSELTTVINAVIERQGGLAVIDGKTVSVLPLPIGGIMSNADGETVAREYAEINDRVAKMGCTLDFPFMTLSFLSLIVIPEIKIGEKGLFCYEKFDWLENN